MLPMKDRIGAIVRAEQERYLDRLLPPRDELMREMEAHAAREDIPISAPEVGRLLTVLARAGRGRLIVEIGTAIGYGALCLARGAPEARVISIDRDPERLVQAREYLRRGGVLDRVELVLGDALDVLPRLAPGIDTVYADCVKTEYRRYLDLLLPNVAIGGTLLFDNLLWKGYVAEPSEEAPEGDVENADVLRAFNGYLMMHPQLASVVLPFGDGVGLATKIKPTLLEMGGPF